MLTVESNQVDQSSVVYFLSFENYNFEKKNMRKTKHEFKKKVYSKKY